MRNFMAENWKCPNCASLNPARRTECWNCGFAKAGTTAGPNTDVKRSKEPEKSEEKTRNILDRIIRIGGVAAAISGILALVFLLYPAWKPKPPSEIQKVEFIGNMSSEAISLEGYLQEAGIPYKSADCDPLTGGAVQSAEAIRSFCTWELESNGVLLNIPMRIVGTTGNTYYLEWSIYDASNNMKVYSSKSDFSAEIEVQYPSGDQLFSRIWVPTEQFVKDEPVGRRVSGQYFRRVGTFFVRVQI
jgi:hypothetical protein